MRRRDVLAGAGSLATGAAGFPAPAIAQGLRQLKMVTAWPAGSPGLQSSAERLAQRISTASDGRINIRVFPAGAFVGPFETFDAVGGGSSKTQLRPNTRAPSRSSTSIMRCGCADCGTKATSRS
jgi:TRAP-type mannitol/chloroaromatic compound transport system substrate-binding protein